VVGKKPLELPAEEEVDARQQDRRHGANVSLVADATKTGQAMLRNSKKRFR
jgi:hypothetical protein